jgi:hypothetical protein
MKPATGGGGGLQSASDEDDQTKDEAIRTTKFETTKNHQEPNPMANTEPKGRIQRHA